MSQPDEKGSPLWWLKRLVGRMDDRRRKVGDNRNYYRGDHPLPGPPKGTSAEVDKEAQRSFRHMTRLGITNWVALVADAPCDRLEVVGFRFGKGAEPADNTAWDIWQRNQLDADSGLLHATALQTGQAFMLVWPSASGHVDVTCETPSQCIVAYGAGQRRARAAGLKMWEEDDGRLCATLYMPDFVWKWKSRSSRPNYGVAMGDMAWVPREVPSEVWPLPNPLGAVPLVEFRANADLEPAPFGGGEAEFARVITIQDRINKTIFDRLVTAEYQAFRQRYVIGWEVPTLLDAAGRDTGRVDKAAMAQASASRVWTLANSDGGDIKVGEFAQASFEGFIAAVSSDVAAMAAISKTPPDYLLASMDNIGAEALAQANAKLVAKVRRHAANFGESYEEVLRLALKAIGDPHAEDTSSMILWKDMQFRTWGETVDAVVKMQTVGVPEEELWARLPDVTPQDIARWKAMKAQDQLFAADTQVAPGPPRGIAPTPTPAPPAPVPVPAR